MKISLVTPGFPPDKTGGIENYVGLVFRELRAMGHDVRVITKLHSTNLETDEVEQLTSGEGEIGGYAEWTIKAWFRLREEKPDVAHFNGFPGQILSLAPLPGMPKVVHIHNSLTTDPEWWVRAPFRHAIGYRIVVEAFRSSSLVISPTQVVKDDLMRHVPSLPEDKIRVIPNCVDTNRFAPGSVPTSVREKYGLGHKFVVLYFGKIKRTKGIEELCKAVALLKGKVDAALILGGSSAASDSFANHLKETYEGVILTGFVEDPRPYYEAADAFAIYTPGFYGGETFAIALAEAMSMGLPIVCSDNPIFHEVTHENAVFVRPKDPEALAEGLLSLARDPSRARVLGSRSREVAGTNYNARHVARQLEVAYREAAN